ncbi:class I SAM-dependent methyltransferase [Bradyrhizobium prioriisuperbiae]|uniref:class I SAM-dependent methyltransferase n=1 Tax=Bradyrhizobium prioriisuperbiae TaxID=2854389 RepID=UPI0028E4136E|nr:class I SAM-dependent methyltransferase [Bradyrhizobium prioritasuperba]
MFKNLVCRHCGTAVSEGVADLGYAPPSNSYLAPADLRSPETSYPLRVNVCTNCWLVQTEDYADAGELFSKDYAYFSSTSKSWLEHAKNYTTAITSQLKLDRRSFVIEVASNDGYLLKNFVAAGIPCLGIEPTESTARVAEELGIPVHRKFFGAETADALVREGKAADLICGNNVYAHVPDINDFTSGLRIALKPYGTITLEFPHLMRLMELCQFDTIYHEHFSYLSLAAVNGIFASHGLRVFDVEELSTHGGSLRVYGCHSDDPREVTLRTRELLDCEDRFGIRNVTTYRSFQRRVDRLKDDFVSFLIEQKRAGKTVAAYGAAAKGNTLLNYAGVRPDLLPFVCDAAASKIGKFLPGSHLPILQPSEIESRRPDFVIILPWNIADEVMKQLSTVRGWGGKFVTAVPEIKVMA